MEAQNAMQPCDKGRRDASLERMAATLHDLYAGTHEVEAARELQRVYLAEKDRYLDSLARVAVARCPFSQEPFEMAIDTAGLDGPWWDVNGPDSIGDRRNPRHVVTLGSLDLREREPVESDSPLIQSIEPGPGVPFLLPRLMRFDSVRCVIGSLPIGDGRYCAYLMSYFSDPPLEAAQGHQSWLRGSLSFRAQGQILWKRLEDAWDFDLRPWLSAEPVRVFWIAPGDTTLTLRTGVQGCPYVELTGPRALQVIRNGRVVRMNPPSNRMNEKE